MDYEDHYKILGISEIASEADITKAYRSLASKTHPDNNKNDPDATRKFQQIVRAYEILSNWMKRMMYDVSRTRGAYDPTRTRGRQAGQEEDEKTAPEEEYFDEENRIYTENRSEQKGEAPNSGYGEESKPTGVRAALYQKPAPGAYRYTPEGMPVGKEEESRPERAKEEFERWEREINSGPPPGPVEEKWTWD